MSALPETEIGAAAEERWVGSSGRWRDGHRGRERAQDGRRVGV